MILYELIIHYKSVLNYYNAFTVKYYEQIVSY